MYSGSINQIQSGDDEKEEDQPEDGDNSITKNSPIKQTFFSYYNNQHFGPTLKSAVKKSPDFVCRKRKPPAHGGKDRHSKVRTARGLRDRRLRLSPTTAIQFYDVQDRLGYDRPSKAIDWLIQEAKTAIDALSHHPNAAAADNRVSPSSEFQAYLDQDFNAASQILELQKMLTWNCENENSGGGGGAEYSTVTGDMFCEREPLQSINTDFPEFSFYNELSNITASAILNKEDEKDYKLAPSSSSTFLHFED